MHNGARLSVQVAGAVREFDQDRVVVGRGVDCDVVVSDARASRHHLGFHRQDGTWVVTDTSSNGTFSNGHPVQQLAVPAGQLVLNLGGPQGEPVVVWATALAPPAPPPPAAGYADPTRAGARAEPQSQRPVPPAPPEGIQHRLPPGQLAHGHTILPVDRQGVGSLTIGRELGNDVVLTDPLVSRHHARLDLAPVPVLHDLGSFNGTFVNGQRLHGSVPLEPGHEVIFGNQTFRWDGSQLVASATKDEFTLYADGLTTVVAEGKVLLDHVAFQLDPSSLTAVIGPSGAGKSTLLGALTGLRPATHGRVIWQGHDLYTHYDQLRFQIGLVPQQDIQHPQLKVKEALGYAAELRLPPDTTRQERDTRVHTVAGQLQLGQRLDNRIGTELSGGQRKRVSIATELLTAPPLLFLDEPTSGLDPGLDLEVMRQLRSLADDGRVVMVVTHSVLALDVCDNVMVLAPGGRIAYFGPPTGVLEHFGCRNYPEVFDLLDEPDLWQRIPVPPRTADTGRVAALPAAAVPAPPHQSFARQLTTLVRRNTAVVMADRLLLAMLVLLPLVLGGLSRLVPGDHGLSLDDARFCPGDARAVNATQCQPQREGQPFGDLVAKVFDPSEASQRLIVLIVAACLMGVAMTIRELVGERPIFRREYAVGLSPGIYFLSKVLVLGAAAFVQGMLVTWIATVGLPGPDGDLGVLRVALVIGALTFTMAVVGLGLSAVVTSTEQTMPALVGMIMVQLVLSGALFPVNGRPVLEQIAWLSPSRWAYAACASVLGMTRTTDPGEDEDWIARSGGEHYLMDVAMLGGLCLVALGLGLFLVRRSATKE